MRFIKTNKKYLIFWTVISFAFLFITTISQAALPHAFEGYATDDAGRMMPDGVNITVLIIDQHDAGGGIEYQYTAVDNSLPDNKNYMITLNDTTGSHGAAGGAQIHFFINGVNTTNSTTFVNGKIDTNYNITIEDKPEIVDNSASFGTTGDPFTFNVTVTDIIDPANNLTVKANWSHGSLSGNLTLENSGGDFFENSTALDHNLNNMTYYIWVKDNSNVENITSQINVSVFDNDKPNSSVDTISVYWKNSSDNPLTLTGIADDNIGLKNVSLYYNFSSDNSTWSSATIFDNDTDPWTQVNWSFTFPQGDGYYRFYSVAHDNASNTEDAPDILNDTFCGYDSVAPDASLTVLSSYIKDDFTVEWSATEVTSGIASWTVEYRKNITGTWTAWLTNVSYLTNSSTWEIANTTESCTVYFRALGVDNASNVGSFSSTINTIKDTTAPTSSIYNQTGGNYSYFQNDSLTIYANIDNSSEETNASGLKNVTLWYWYNNATNNHNKTNTTWSSHMFYSASSGASLFDNLPNVTLTFNFANANGTGYYRFYTMAYDNASNNETLITNVNHTDVINTECFYNNSYPNVSSNPTPSNGATGISLSQTLSWTGGDPDTNDTVTYDVYFGQDATPDSGELRSSNQTDATYDPSLSYSTTYYWQIITWDNHNASTNGPIWHFTTTSDPGGGGGSGSGSGSGSGDTTVPTTPANVRWTSSSDDNTPSFAWDAATDNVAISGYYVKIDDGAETSIDNVLTWASTSTVSDGSHTFYVRAKDTSNNYGSYGSVTFVIDTTGGVVLIPPVADAGGPYIGLTFENITFDASNSTDSDGNIENYTWDLGDGTIAYGKEPIHSYNLSGLFNITLTVTDNHGLTGVNQTSVNITLDSDADGWSDELEEAYGKDPHNASDGPEDTDGDKLPDDDSPDGTILGDPDDDNDGLEDTIEEELGLDPKDDEDVKAIIIDGKTHYLLDTNGDGKWDTFYNSETGKTYKAQKKKDGKIKIDTDGDGKWDYVYDPVLGTVIVYEEEEEKPDEFPIVIVGVIAIILIIIIIIAGLFKTGYLYVEVEDKKIKEPSEKKQEDQKKKTDTKKSKNNTKSKKK